MALNNTTGGAVGDAINSAIQALSDADKADPAKCWEAVGKALYSALKTDVVITILASSIVTVGSAATQTGPASPIPLSPA